MTIRSRGLDLPNSCASILEQLVAKARENAQQKEAVDLADDSEDFHGVGANDLNDGEDKDTVDEDLSDEDAAMDDDWDDGENPEDDEDWDEDEEFEEDENWDEDALLEADEDWGEDDDFEDDGNDITPDVGVELAFVVSDLADLADPLAVDLIKTAFAEGLVDGSFIDQEEVDEHYRYGGAAPQARVDWLELYRTSYDKHVEALEPSVLPAPIARFGPDTDTKIDTTKASRRRTRRRLHRSLTRGQGWAATTPAGAAAAKSTKGATWGKSFRDSGGLTTLLSSPPVWPWPP